MKKIITLIAIVMALITTSCSKQNMCVQDNLDNYIIEYGEGYNRVIDVPLDEDGWTRWSNTLEDPKCFDKSEPYRQGMECKYEATEKYRNKFEGFGLVLQFSDGNWDKFDTGLQLEVTYNTCVVTNKTTGESVELTYIGNYHTMYSGQFTGVWIKVDKFYDLVDFNTLQTHRYILK